MAAMLMFDAEEKERRRRIPGVFRDRTQLLEFVDTERDIEREYRSTRQGCMTLLGPKLNHNTGRSNSLPGQLQKF